MAVSRQFKRGERHVYRHVGGEHMLIAIHRDSVAPLFSLTYTGAAVWQALAEWTTADRVVDAIVDEFDIDRAQAASDVTEFLDQLRQIGALLVREEGA